MKTQSLERTFVDKLFAVCDYFMNENPTRNSRHLYDIYKLYPYITVDETFRALVVDVRKHRSTMNEKLAPSARSEVNVFQKVKEMLQTDFYRKDYEESTMKLIRDDLSYKKAVQCYSQVMEELFL